MKLIQDHRHSGWDVCQCVMEMNQGKWKWSKGQDLAEQEMDAFRKREVVL